MQPLSPPVTFPRVSLGISTVSDEVIVIGQIIFVQWNSQFLKSVIYFPLSSVSLQNLSAKKKKIHQPSCMVLDMSEFKANFYLFNFYQFIFFFLKEMKELSN